jgi:hypothetical protein
VRIAVLGGGNGSFAAGGAFPGAIEPCGDALSGALMNAGPIMLRQFRLAGAAEL